MNRHISVSELALDLIYKALDCNQQTVERRSVIARSEKEFKAGSISSPSNFIQKVVALAPNFGIKLV